MDKILIVEDDILLNRGIKLALEKNNYSVACTYTYSEGYSYFTAESFNLILLDINLPDKSGLELCNQIRKTSQVPIIFITANDTEQDVVRGFLSGCDDYMAKPFSLEVLYRRIQAVLRRMGKTENNVFSSGEILIDYDKMQVKRADETVKLTATEYRLLTLLTKNSGQVLTRRSILEKLWDVDEAFVDENALSVNMRRLRQKLEKDPKKPYYIKTVFGIGYTWGGW
ncbi:response regulator transcription factor [Ruminiclostridium cellobioparum]|uniref:Stage 0 sporulation protein A homolog n=1 Tax=Ruminiclostridium cellobioparum subsp. termitidis CT1112 TaxID=1195236 RepID=S0FMV7_RUMCE|nr:response regulator transcription factor [Ruminiclostridium cellobioparum]EMS70444.1 two component transcriptional regulator, winged helix family protein [Ruminiclostridium cellobioparum subsp. termitidis CT1112]